MEIRTLKYFIVVAEQLNITKAANILNMSQPPLSYQMKSLEEELKCQLFIRGKRFLKLTEEGKLLYTRAKEIVNLTKKVEEEILSINKGLQGSISLGLIEGISKDIGYDWFDTFLKKYNNIKFIIENGNSDDLIAKINEGSISLAVISAPYNQIILNGFLVGKDNFVALVNKDNPLSKNESITLKDLKNQNLIVPARKTTIDIINKWFKNEKITPKITFEVNSFYDASSLVKKNLGIALFPNIIENLDENLFKKNISGKDTYSIDYYFVWKKGRPLLLAEEKYIDFVKEKVMNQKII